MDNYKLTLFEISVLEYIYKNIKVERKIIFERFSSTNELRTAMDVLVKLKLVDNIYQYENYEPVKVIGFEITRKGSLFCENKKQAEIKENIIAEELKKDKEQLQKDKRVTMLQYRITTGIAGAGFLLALAAFIFR